MRAILVRHAEPDRRLSATDPPLSATGRQQAFLLGRRLAELGGDVLYSSPLTRALQTAAAIGEQQQKAVQTEPALGIGSGDVDALAGLRAHQSRAWSFLEALRDAENVETVICVSHEIVILPLICQAIGLPLERIGQLRQPVGSFSVIEFRRERVQVLTFNEVCHLNDMHLE
jgi:broad specificity phosphatase PhoE